MLTRVQTLYEGESVKPVASLFFHDETESAADDANFDLPALLWAQANRAPHCSESTSRGRVWGSDAGIDFGADWKFMTPIGVFTPALAATYMHAFHGARAAGVRMSTDCSARRATASSHPLEGHAL